MGGRCTVPEVCSPVGPLLASNSPVWAPKVSDSGALGSTWGRGLLSELNTALALIKSVNYLQLTSKGMKSWWREALLTAWWTFLCADS